MTEYNTFKNKTCALTAYHQNTLLSTAKIKDRVENVTRDIIHFYTTQERVTKTRELHLENQREQRHQ